MICFKVRALSIWCVKEIIPGCAVAVKPDVGNAGPGKKLERHCPKQKKEIEIRNWIWKGFTNRILLMLEADQNHHDCRPQNSESQQAVLSTSINLEM